MPSQTCENAYFLKKARFSEKLKIDLKSKIYASKKNFKFFINFSQLEN